MKLRPYLFLSLTVLLATACGGISTGENESEPTPTPSATPTASPTPGPLELTSGLYEISDLVIVSDGCGEFASWDDGDRLGVDVSNHRITIAALYEMDWESETTFAGQLVSEVDFTPGYDCVETSARRFNGRVTATNEAEWSLAIERRILSGTECGLATPGPLPCDSSADMVLSILH